jgi:hypothetical protein
MLTIHYTNGFTSHRKINIPIEQLLDSIHRVEGKVNKISHLTIKL